MRSGRPDAIHKNCLNVQEGLVEACDFDPAMCQPCEATACKWHPSKLAAARRDEDEEEEEEETDEAESDEATEEAADIDPDVEDDARDRE